MRVTLGHKNDLLFFPVVTNDVDNETSGVFVLAVKFLHNALALREYTPTIDVALLWLHATQRPDTIRSYRNNVVPGTGIPRSCGKRLLAVKLFMR
ncbi:hypothetical protein A9B99_17175 [Mangrovibacter phragmitis]|uniref:Uncharacterized protein n=1 Tax=Mangrovibacter phragmitis TaxID=1691903 RepID=A0A1B7KXV3_9ENTR|nr:hypothetical protein A9B99_17175 [Mangrovibacter phragmitis]